MESAACGLLAARNIYARLEGKELPAPPIDTMCGALIQYLTTENKHFQPMGANMGILPRCRRTSAPSTSACVTWPWPNGPWPASSSGWRKILCKMDNLSVTPAACHLLTRGGFGIS